MKIDNLKKWVSSFCLVLFSIGMVAYGQSTIKGTITTDTGTPLPGVSIQVKGKQTGTVSNSKGFYQLTVPVGSQTLIFSATGYETKRMDINGKTELNLVLP